MNVRKNLKSPTGKRIIGTYEVLFGCAQFDKDGLVSKDNALTFNYDGETDIDYDSGKTLKEQFSFQHGATQETENKGQTLFVDSEWGIWTADEVLKGKPLPKKVRVGRKPSTLTKAVDNMSPEALRDFVQQVAERVLVDTDDSNRCFLNPNKDLEGADTIEFLSNLLERTGLWPKGR